MEVLAPRKRVAFGLMAFIGALCAHALAYGLAAPEPAHHAALMDATGHGPWSYLSAGLAALAVALGPGILYRSADPSRGVPDAVRLGVMQMLVFVSMEVVERAATGHGVASAFSILVLLGLLLQVPVAVGLALVLRLLASVPRSTRRAAFQPANVPSIVLPRISTSIPKPILSHSPCVPRAPPETARTTRVDL
jgi:hypothetical protein